MDTPFEVIYNDGTQGLCYKFLFCFNNHESLHKDVKKMIIGKLLESCERTYKTSALQ